MQLQVLPVCIVVRYREVTRVLTKSQVHGNSIRNNEITCIAKKSDMTTKSHTLQQNHMC